MAKLHSKVPPTQVLIFALLQQLCLLLHTGVGGGVSLRSQHEALLQWKSTLRRSPALDSWRQGTSPCSSNWTGVACGIMHHGRHASPVVTNISLPKACIDGRLGDLNFSALPFLTHLDLSFNSLQGKIPPAVSCYQCSPTLILATTGSMDRYHRSWATWIISGCCSSRTTTLLLISLHPLGT